MHFHYILGFLVHLVHMILLQFLLDLNFHFQVLFYKILYFLNFLCFQSNLLDFLLYFLVLNNIFLHFFLQHLYFLI